MKQSKKLLAILLTLALALTLAAPAAFADEEATKPAINWDDFYITSQPPEELSLPFGSDITLRIEVNAPEGTEVTYQWLVSAEENSGQELRLSPGDFSYPKSAPYNRASAAYYCTITAVELNEDGEAVDSRTLTTRTAVVLSAEREKTIWDTIKEKLSSVWYIIQAFGFFFIVVPFGVLVQLAGVGGQIIISFVKGLFS